jgi:drug/metabolite transporter (DMT)-like permease
MQVATYAAAGMAMAGSFILSLGMAMQKRNIGWIGRRRPWDRSFYRAFALWLLGFVLMNIVPVFNFFALMGLPTNVVGAAAGLSVAFTAILAKLMLKEKLGKRRLAWTLLLFGAIAAAGFMGEGGSSGNAGLSRLALLCFLALPLVAGILLVVFRGRFKGPRLGAILAAISGCLAGFMVFPLRALQLDAGEGILGWLASPYLYAYLAAGISSFILIQLAYKDGEMSAVAPALYGMQVLWPALGSHFVFGARFVPVQTAAFVLVAICVVVIAGIHPAAKKPVALLTDDRDKGGRTS